jgi:hypothetical protein
VSTPNLSGLRRKSFSPWVRYPSLVLLYGVLVPLAKMMEKTGLWNRLSKRRGRDFYGNFGDYQATIHDVFACVYFKSGTNWLMQILEQVIYHGAAEFEHIHDLVPWPDSPDPDYAVPLSDETAWKNSPTGLRVIKTHREFAKVPYSPEARYICVVRDPKDVCVSAYHFSRAEAMGRELRRIFPLAGFPVLRLALIPGQLLARARSRKRALPDLRRDEKGLAGNGSPNRCFPESGSLGGRGERSGAVIVLRPHEADRTQV